MKNFLSCVFLICLICSSGAVHSTVVSANHSDFGVGSVTYDANQNLSFLDLSFTIGRSFLDVSSEFSSGGEFEGFRYATESEVIALINNWGFLPGAVAGQDINGVNGTDLSGLQALLGITDQQILQGGEIAATNGITSTTTGTNFNRTVRFFDVISPIPLRTEDYVVANQSLGITHTNAVYGSYLVQTPVPTPGSTLFFCFGVLGLLIRHQRARAT